MSKEASAVSIGSNIDDATGQVVDISVEPANSHPRLLRRNFKARHVQMICLDKS